MVTIVFRTGLEVFLVHYPYKTMCCVAATAEESDVRVW